MLKGCMGVSLNSSMYACLVHLFFWIVRSLEDNMGKPSQNKGKEGMHNMGGFSQNKGKEVMVSDMLFLHELREGSVGHVVVMVCRKWDVTNVNGQYISTDCILSDRQGNTMHCVAKSFIAHQFYDTLKEGELYSIRGFTVQPVQKYRILEKNNYLMDLNGETVVRKATDDESAYVRHPFQLTPFENLRRTDGEFFVDVVGYIASVGEPSVKSTGARTVEFILTNERQKHVNVTLWGALGDKLMKKKIAHPGIYPLILTSMSVKYFSNALNLSSSTSTLLVDGDDVPALSAFKESIRAVNITDYSEVITEEMPIVLTLRELLDSSRDGKGKSKPVLFCNTVEIVSIRTKHSWFLYTCTGAKCRRGVTREGGHFKCRGCKSQVDYPRTRYRVQADITDGTMNTVVVLFDETAETLVKRPAKSLLDELQQSATIDVSALPPVLGALVGTKHVFEIKSYTYYHYGEYESFNCARVILPETTALAAQNVGDNSLKHTEAPVVHVQNVVESSMKNSDARGLSPSATLKLQPVTVDVAVDNFGNAPMMNNDDRETSLPATLELQATAVDVTAENVEDMPVQNSVITELATPSGLKRPNASATVKKRVLRRRQKYCVEDSETDETVDGTFVQDDNTVRGDSVKKRLFQEKETDKVPADGV